MSESDSGDTGRGSRVFFNVYGVGALLMYECWSQ